MTPFKRWDVPSKAKRFGVVLNRFASEKSNILIQNGRVVPSL